LNAALPAWRHIAIEGPIGAGKTTLAQRLAERLGGQTLLERPEDNPFLDRFYADRPGYAFQVQLAFLFHRVRQLQEAAQRGMFGGPMVTDFVFAKDRLFAEMNLSDDEFRLYAPMYAQFEPQIPPPDIVIWLRAGTPTLLARIRERGVASEQAIDADYLDRLAAGYVEMFRSWAAAPVLVVGTEDFHPAARDADLDELLAAMAALRGPRGTLRMPEPAPLG
jgi:deoxyguanosine kinase